MTSLIKEAKPKASRQSFGEALAELGAKHPKVVVCDADLSKSTKSDLFAKKFPERFFQIGIAEANMIGIGAGLASSGFTPFVCSFGAFVTGRYDQIRMSVAYAGANVRIVGTHSGVGIGDDGHSQMGLEDLGMMRALPTMVVLQPCDDIETRQMMSLLCADPDSSDGLNAPAYLRLTRQNLAAVHGPEYRWQLGKIDVLKRARTAAGAGSAGGIALLATGGTVAEAARAEEELARLGLEITLVNVHTLKPFDSTGVAELARTHRTLFTVEDHYTTGGLGSAVAEALATAGSAARLVRLGVTESFGESGDPAELYDKFGISARRISEAVLSVAR